MLDLERVVLALRDLALTEEAIKALQDEGIYLYGLVFFLILVHGLHVMGGILPLVNITVKAHRGRYDHEHHGPVKYIAMYWHFLDGVWVTMFAVLIVTA